jgi:uncharacterized protein YjgD (DUF1641 family)
MASAYIGFNLLEGSFYFYASVLQTSLANAIEAVAGNGVAKYLPSWMGKIAIGGFDHEACVAAEKRGDYGNPACFAIVSFATVPTVIPIHPPINVAMGLTISIGIEVFGTFSGLYLNVAPTKGIINMKLLGPCIHLAGGKLIIARSPSELHKGPELALDIAPGVFKGIADCYIKVGNYVVGWFDLEFSKSDFKFYAGLFLFGGSIGADIKASVNPRTHLPNYLSFNLYLGPIGKIIEEIIDALKKPILAILHGINAIFQSAKAKLQSALNTLNHDISKLNNAKHACDKAKQNLDNKKKSCDKVLVQQTELETWIHPTWIRGGRDDPLQGAHKGHVVVRFWEPSHADRVEDGNYGNELDLVQVGWGSCCKVFTHFVSHCAHAVAHVVKKVVKAVKKGIAFVCKGALSVLGTIVKKLCYAGIAVAKGVLVIAQRALAAIKKIVDKIAAVVKVAMAKAEAFIESIEFNLQYLGFAADFSKGTVTLKADVALGKNAKPKMYKFVINPSVVLKAFKHLGVLFKKEVLEPIANFAKKEMNKLWNSIKHAFEEEVDELVQEVDDSHKTSTKLLKPIADTYNLIERFDDEYTQDPNGFQAKLQHLREEAGEAPPAAKDNVDWGERWALIERESRVKKAVKGGADECQHHCKHDAGKSKCSECLENNNRKVAHSECDRAVKNAAAPNSSKKVAYETCKKKVAKVLKKNKDVMKISSKCVGKMNPKCLVDALTDVCLAKDPSCKADAVNFHTCKKTPNDKCCLGLKACAGKITHNPDIADEDDFGDAQAHQHKADGARKNSLDDEIDMLVEEVADGHRQVRHDFNVKLHEHAAAAQLTEVVMYIGRPKDIMGDPVAKCRHHCKDDAGKDKCDKCLEAKNEHTAHEQCRLGVQDAAADDESKVTAYNTCKQKVAAVLKKNKDTFKISSKCVGKMHPKCLIDALTDVCLAKNPMCKVQNIDFHTCKSKPNDKCCLELNECTGRITGDPHMAEQDNFGDAQAAKHKMKKKAEL